MSLGLIKDAFRAKVDREIDRLKSGVLLGFVEPHQDVTDEMRVMQTRMYEFHQALGIRASLYLTMAMIGQRIKMWTPQGSATGVERKYISMFPVPFALRMSLRNETTYRMARSKRPILKKGEAFFDSGLGLIVSNKSWPQAIFAWGDGDLDDKGVVFMAKFTKDHVFNGVTFRAGEVVFIVFRHPIGSKSDNDKLGSEYFILKPTRQTRDWIMGKYGRSLPMVNPDDLPVSVIDIEAPKAGRVPTPMPMPPEGYTKQFFWDKVMAMTRTQGVYDKHAATVRKFHLYGIPYTYEADEYFYIDATAQFLNPVDLEWIMEDNDIKSMELASQVDLEEPTILDELVDFARSEVTRFYQAAMEYLRNLQEYLEESCEEYEYQGRLTQDGTPLLVSRINRVMDKVKPDPNSFKAFEEFGNLIAEKLENKESEGEARELQELEIVDAYVYYLTHIEVSERYATPTALFRGHERVLVSGAMFDRLLEALTAN